MVNITKSLILGLMAISTSAFAVTTNPEQRCVNEFSVAVKKAAHFAGQAVNPMLVEMRSSRDYKDLATLDRKALGNPFMRIEVSKEEQTVRSEAAKKVFIKTAEIRSAWDDAFKTKAIELTGEITCPYLPEENAMSTKKQVHDLMQKLAYVNDAYEKQNAMLDLNMMMRGVVYGFGQTSGRLYRSLDVAYLQDMKIREIFKIISR